jgi:Tfp pilus assembly protein PilP
MLNKGFGESREKFIEKLMEKKDKGSECIVNHMGGENYGRIVSVGFDKIVLDQEGELISINIDDILEVR